MGEFFNRISYVKAGFCYEEFLTANPTNYLANLRYAEVRTNANI
jgi:hypothetical protein